MIIPRSDGTPSLIGAFLDKKRMRAVRGEVLILNKGI